MRRSDYIARQASRPWGWVGRMIARIMALETARENRRAIELLDIREGDAVLEVGFGHGRTLARLAATAAGSLAGVEVSPDMLAFAGRHNRNLVRSGHLRLVLGDGRAIPLPDTAFDKALTVHTVYFWPEPVAYLREIHRVLKPGGRLVLGFHEKDEKVAAAFPPEIYRFYEGGEIASLLRQAGFADVEIRPADEHSRGCSFALGRA